MRRLLLPLLACSLFTACSSVGGVVTSSSTLHQARVAVHNGDLPAGMNLYRLVLDDARDGSQDQAEARFHIALIRMSADPVLTDLGEARFMLDAIRSSSQDDYRRLEVGTLLASLDRISGLGGNVAGVEQQMSALRAEIARLEQKLIEKDETLRKINAAVGAR